MMNQETNHGITYSLSLLRNGDYSKALFWLGVKPLDFDDLHELLTNISDNRLRTIIEELLDESKQKLEEAVREEKMKQ